jgi:DNA-binding NtrC family response regulator
MPGMGGHKCLSELIKINPSVKVLIASGYSQNGTADKTMNAGARGFIEKPFQIVELLRKIREILETD